jgi:hypothetical protein
VLPSACVNIYYSLIRRTLVYIGRSGTFWGHHEESGGHGASRRDQIVLVVGPLAP